jgi:undecaprenyl-diphosphatase
MRWLRDHKEFPTLVVVLLLSGFAWAFIELADLVLDGRTHAFDAALLQGLRNPGDVSDPIGPEWVEEMGRDVTALGGVAVLTLITLAVSGFLLLQGLWRSMWLVLASVGGGLAVSTLFKQSFERARPELVPYETAVYTASFPSGHSMMAAVTYLTLGVLLARVQPNRLIKVYLLAIACFITLAVGVSRVYLGVHWPTDVLAGWSAGAAWALLCWTVARWLGRHGRIEPEKDEKRDPRATPR